MLDYSAADAPIDALIWRQIAQSTCPEDFRTYLKHYPEGAAHREEAYTQLIALDDAGITCSPKEMHYATAISQIKQLAEAGNATAQFHMGKILDAGLGMPADAQAAEGWYRAAILQREWRSHINLVNQLLWNRDDKELGDDIAQFLVDAAAAGESTATFIRGRLAKQGVGEPDGKPNYVRAFELFHQAWEEGEPVAGHWIGYMLGEGEGVRQDEELGREWLRKAADKGCIGALQNLAKQAARLETAEGAEQAVAWWKKGAEQDDLESMFQYAYLLLRGECVQKDGALAITWLKRAAARNDVAAQRLLGLTYLWGLDVIRNERVARTWLLRAAQGGDSSAAHQLGRLLQRSEPPQHEEAVGWYRQAAHAGLSTAQCALGDAYWRGSGVDKDSAAAFKWIHLAALQGDPHGLYLLGRAYAVGLATEPDFAKAADCYRRAAGRGNGAGQAQLGLCYVEGKGVDKDIPEGMLWLARAAEQGDAEANYTIGYVLYQGIGVESCPEEAAKWFLAAAEQGDPDAQVALANQYATGTGLKQDMDEARAWMEKAAAKGNEKAQLWLAEHAQKPLLLVSTQDGSAHSVSHDARVEELTVV